jgi:AcrR family transcriptional regulator
MSLRKEKAARLKIQVLDQTLKMLGKKSFDDLYVDDLCAKVKISKVTLFKYFPRKEDILLYYFRMWCLRRSVEMTQKPKEGLAGIYYLFDKLSEASEEHPGLLLALVGYLSDYKRSLKPFPIKAEEKKLAFPEISNAASIEILSLDQLVEKFALEAIFKKEITKSINTRDIANLIMSIFLGGVIVAYVNHQTPLKIFFRKNVDLMLKGM